jgi:hypothetical protein
MSVDGTEHDKNNGEKAGTNVFELYARRTPKERKEGGKMEYYACGVYPESGRGIEEWLRIHREPGRQLEMCRYADILKIYSPAHQVISIMCEDCSFILEGQYVDVIAYHIQHRTLQALYLYDPAIHEEPRPDEPVIYSIAREPEMELGETTEDEG